MVVLGVGLLAVLVFVGLRRWLRFRSALSVSADVMILEHDLSMLMHRARIELGADQISALTDELRSIKRVELHMAEQGVNLWEARRVSLAGAIQSVANHLTLNDLLPD